VDQRVESVDLTRTFESGTTMDVFITRSVK
jgi:hypothetical protein